MPRVSALGHALSLLRGTLWKSWRETAPPPPPTGFIAVCLVDTGVLEFPSQLADVGLELPVH